MRSALPSAYPLDRLRRCVNQACQLTYRVQGPREAPIELAFTYGTPVLVDYCWGCGGEDFEDVGIHELGKRRSLPERGTF